MLQSKSCGLVSSPVRAFIGVGANLDPFLHIRSALDSVREVCRVVGISTFYRTEPIGSRDQPSFVNGVWEVAAERSPRDFKKILGEIEASFGRTRTEDKYRSRPIDLDIILYGDSVIDEPGLRIPDPDIGERPFLSVPLWELAPELLSRGSGQPIREIALGSSKKEMEPLSSFTSELRRSLENE